MALKDLKDFLRFCADDVSKKLHLKRQPKVEEAGQ